MVEKLQLWTPPGAIKIETNNFISCLMFCWNMYGVYFLSLASSKNINRRNFKINRENTLGCSKCKGRGIATSLGKVSVSTSRAYASPKMGRDQVSPMSERPCWRTASVANALWKHLVIYLKVNFGNKAMVLLKVWSMEGVIVYGQVSEYHLTFVKG